MIAQGDLCTQGQDPITGITTIAWPPSKDDYGIYVVEVQRCIELDLMLRQNPTGAVLCRKNVPPECISKVIDFQGNVLYQNDLLNQAAPDDRKDNMDVGAP